MCEKEKKRKNGYPDTVSGGSIGLFAVFYRLSCNNDATVQLYRLEGVSYTF